MTKVETNINNSFYPLPAILVTAGKKGNWNVMTAAWASKICMEPPTLCVAVRKERLTHPLIVEHGTFALNIPTADLVEAVDICGVVSGREMDKFERCGLTPIEGPKTGTAIIEECPVVFECEVTNTVNIGSHDLFIGKVVSRLVDPEYMGEHGKMDYDILKPLIYLSPHYTTFEEIIATHGFSKKLL